MANLDTVQEYITQARFLLHDAEGVRYTDPAVVNALNDGIQEIKRMRPDIFFGVTIPTAATGGSLVAIPDIARVALLNYVCAYAETSDQEASDVGRATLFGNRFIAQMASAGTTP